MRIDRGQNTLDHYMDLHPDHVNCVIRSQEALTDLLTDLRHACKDDGLNIDAAILMSEIHFEAEIEGEL